MSRRKTPSAPAARSKTKSSFGRKDLKPYVGHWHHSLASHLRAAGSGYSTGAYDPMSALRPSNLWRWISHVSKYIFQKKHPFRDYSTRGKGTGIYAIDNAVKLSLVGDWGTGTDEANLVAGVVQKSAPDFTIHLGDVYYVGDENEIRENFLGEKTSPYEPVMWPMGKKGSFALSGNHEMYANGTGYYKNVLPKMGLRVSHSEWGEGQWASFFCLENDYWRIIAIDTAYNSAGFDWGRVPLIGRSKWLRKGTHLKPSCRLPDPLVKWLTSTVNPDGDQRGLILLSHHGCYSAFSEWYQIPAKQLAPVIHRPVIWFWGHEHRMAIYDRYGVPGGIEAHGRCIGHGGMPVERGAAPDIPDCRWLAWDNRRYSNSEKLDLGFNGHVDVSLSDASAHFAYYDLNRALLFTEDWRIDLETGVLDGPHLKKVLPDPALHYRAK
jgi:hypothetical protein